MIVKKINKAQLLEELSHLPIADVNVGNPSMAVDEETGEETFAGSGIEFVWKIVPTVEQSQEAHKILAEHQQIDDYRLDRLREYDLLAQQLDALWHDIDDGKLDKTGNFYNSIKQVKDENPKE